MKTAREFAEEILKGLGFDLDLIGDVPMHIASEIEQRDAKRKKELKAPMDCGHPYACWTPGVVVFDSIDVLNREKTKMPYCAWCAETAELRAGATKSKEEEDAAIMAANTLGDELRRVRAGAAAVKSDETKDSAQ